jgi:hypothetical protein
MLDHQPRALAELQKYTPKLCTKEAGWKVHRALEIYSKALSTKEAGSPTYVRAREVKKIQSSLESSNFAVHLSISVEFIAFAVAI